MSTYLIHPESITCLLCGRTSYHPDDVKHKYCGHCHIFHEDLEQETQHENQRTPEIPDRQRHPGRD